MSIKTSFGKFADIWDARAGTKGTVGSQGTIKAVLKLLNAVEGSAIYEIACGNGFLARKLVISGVREVYASDISPELIDIAKTRYSTRNIVYSVREGTDFKKIPKNHFDAVVIHQGIFYIEDVNSLLKGIASVLKRNGVLVFTIFHPLFPLYRKDIGEKTAMGEPVDLIKLGKHYLQSSGGWIYGEAKRENYFNYHRPMSYYINLCGKHGLFVQSVIEAKSQKLKLGKLLKSDIPGALIIKAVKV